jgi:hypothetical protein
MTFAQQTNTGKRDAQISAERRGLLTMSGIILLTCAPAFLWMFNGEALNMPVTSPAIIFVWIFNFWLFGPQRMINGGILLFQSTDGPVPSKDEIEQFATGLAIEKNLPSPQSLHVIASLNSDARLNAYFEGADRTQTHLSSEDCNALLDFLTGDGNIYRLTVASGRSFKVSWVEEEMSTHARIAAVGLVHKNRIEAKQFRS